MMTSEPRNLGFSSMVFCRPNRIVGHAVKISQPCSI